MEYLGQLNLEGYYNTTPFKIITKYIQKKFPERSENNDLECYDWDEKTGQLEDCRYGFRNIACKEGYAKEGQEQGSGCRECPPHSWNDGSAGNCSCHPGYHLYKNSTTGDWLCRECQEDTYRGGGLNETCQNCPDGRSTLNMVGVKSLEGCCDKGTEVESFGKCVNKFILPCCLLVALVVVAVVLACGVRLFNEGISVGETERSQCAAKCRSASRP